MKNDSKDMWEFLQIQRPAEIDRKYIYMYELRAKVHQFARAPKTNCHRPGGLNNRTLFPHSSGG